MNKEYLTNHCGWKEVNYTVNGEAGWLVDPVLGRNGRKVVRSPEGAMKIQAKRDMVNDYLLGRAKTWIGK